MLGRLLRDFAEERQAENDNASRSSDATEKESSKPAVPVNLSFDDSEVKRSSWEGCGR